MAIGGIVVQILLLVVLFIVAVAMGAIGDTLESPPPPPPRAERGALAVSPMLAKASESDIGVVLL